MKRVVSISLLLVVGLIGSANAQAVRRTVLLEEGTNSSCGPCAQMNPLVAQFMASKGDSIIQIAYHPNWPGANDPMYLNDTKDNMDRVVSYYGISGVPAVAISGRDPFIPAAVSYMQSRFDSVIALPTPIVLHVSRTQTATDVNMTVCIVAVGNVSAYRKLVLRTAAVEKYVDGPGPNGELRYENAMRAMMPSSTGTALTLKQGDSVTFHFSYSLDPAYHQERMYEVAFVQDDNTHEVLQAASTQEMFEVTPKAGEAPLAKLSGSSGSTTLQINNTTPEDLTFTAKYVPIVGKDWTLSINGQYSASVPVASGSASDLTIGVGVGTGPYASGLVVVSAVTGRGDTIVTSTPVKFIAPTTQIAFVDVSGDSTKSAPTLRSLTSLKLDYVPLTDVEATTIHGWDAAQFPTMIVEANKWIITGTDKATVAAYLHSGGHLLVHGGEIAYGLADPASTASDQDIPFLENVLRADYVQDVSSTMKVHGVTNDPISNSLATTSITINVPNTDNPVQPDVITPANGSVPFFYYGTDQSEVAAVRWDSAQTKLAYLAFGLQNLSGTNQNKIITAILNWFGTQSSAPTNNSYSFDIAPNYPNPFFASTDISYTLPQTEPVEITILDTKGTVVRTLANDIESLGTHSLTFDARDMVPGSYFCVIRTADGTKMRAITLE